MKKHIISLITVVLFCFACHQEQVVSVEIDVHLQVKDDRTAPVYVHIENKTRNAEGYSWTFEGGNPAVSSLRNPDPVRFETPGEHRITLEAWNEGSRETQTFTVRVDSAVTADFTVEADVNNYAPAVFKITNLSSGGTTYRWTFAGGEPSVYEGQNPPVVRYVEKGSYTIILTVENGSAVFTAQKEIEVRESMDASFTITPSFEDEDDLEAPLRATLAAELMGIESQEWSCPGAEIQNKTQPVTSIYFPTAGDYSVTLEVSNGKEKRKITQTYTVKPNTNLRTHHDIRLGINTAQETTGSYYSTRLRKLFKASEITEENGKDIDIVFFGMNADFMYNQFVSPDELQATPLKEIPNASHTHFINLLEDVPFSITIEQWNAMTTDEILKSLPITEQIAGNGYFEKTPLPRIVLFETGDGRKGAILVKEMVSLSPAESYIVADIKIQKND